MTDLKQHSNEISTLAVMAGVAVAVGIGQGTAKALLAAALLLAIALGAWVFRRVNHRDDDLSNIIAGRADERQVQIEYNANYVAGRIAIAACAVATIVQIARGENAWPYAQIFMAAAAGYLVTLVAARFRG